MEIPVELIMAVAAKECQVALFVCWPGYDEIAFTVVVLDRIPLS